MNRIYIHLINIIFILVLFFFGSLLCNFLLLLLLQTSLKWLIFSTYCTHLSICWALSGWMNGTTVLASLSHRHSVLFSWFHLILHFHSVSCKYFFQSLRFLGWLNVPFVPQLLLPMPGLAHLSHYDFLLCLLALYDYFYTHVTVIQLMYKLLFQLPINFLIVTFCGGCSKSAHPLFCTFVYLSA